MRSWEQSGFEGQTIADHRGLIKRTKDIFKQMIHDDDMKVLRKLWLTGGFPKSYLAVDQRESFDWRNNFIRTFLERDIPQLGFKIPSKHIERFWMMCAHVHGQILNRSKLGESLGVSYHTIQSYLDILENTYMVRVLRPLEGNMKKRLIKSPKLYLRDTGLLHTLLQIVDQNDLLGHPVYGSSWEGFALENILSSSSIRKPYFYRNSNRSEIDLVLEKANKRIAIEFKVSTSPTVSKGFYNALKDIEATEAWIIAPIKEIYPLKKDILAAPLWEIIKYLERQ